MKLFFAASLFGSLLLLFVLAGRWWPPPRVVFVTILPAVLCALPLLPCLASVFVLTRAARHIAASLPLSALFRQGHPLAELAPAYCKPCNCDHELLYLHGLLIDNKCANGLQSFIGRVQMLCCVQAINNQSSDDCRPAWQCGLHLVVARMLRLRSCIVHSLSLSRL